MQNIVTYLCVASRKGLTNWLREFIKVDNHRALEVGLGNLLRYEAERIRRIPRGDCLSGKAPTN